MTRKEYILSRRKGAVLFYNQAMEAADTLGHIIGESKTPDLINDALGTIYLKITHVVQAIEKGEHDKDFGEEYDKWYAKSETECSSVGEV